MDPHLGQLCYKKQLEQLQVKDNIHDFVWHYDLEITFNEPLIIFDLIVKATIIFLASLNGL